jgi:hypothetical protein
MFKGYPLGSLRIFATQEILLALHKEAQEGDVKNIVLTENYIQFQPEIKFDDRFDSEYSKSKNELKKGVRDTEGFYSIEFYEGIKFNQLRTDSADNSNFLFDSDEYDTWEKNIFDKYSFEAEYIVYLNSPERKKEKQLRQINKLEKILASQKQKVLA